VVALGLAEQETARDRQTVEAQVASAVDREAVAAPFKASIAAVAQPGARASAGARAWEASAAAEPPEAVVVAVVQEVAAAVVQGAVGVVEEDGADKQVSGVRLCFRENRRNTNQRVMDGGFHDHGSECR
jgi:hypothetical protein